ncbi:hypothetical protein HYV86_06790 [Candidatus Woesearchaeota archaeon]|nr:hypothetical protein [Candidatus Woesearchaeota archaeon]
MGFWKKLIGIGGSGDPSFPGSAQPSKYPADLGATQELAPILDQGPKLAIYETGVSTQEEDRRYASFGSFSRLGRGGTSHVYLEQDSQSQQLFARKAIYLFRTFQRETTGKFPFSRPNIEYSYTNDNLFIHVNGEPYQVTAAGVSGIQKDRLEQGSLPLYFALHELYATAITGSAGIPNILPFKGREYVLDKEGRLFLLLDIGLVSGVGLKQKAVSLANTSPDSYAYFTGRVLEDVIREIQGVHQQKVVHNDIKGENIHVVRARNSDSAITTAALLFDFGIARVHPGTIAAQRISDPLRQFLFNPREEWDGFVSGTIGYICPEKAINPRHNHEPFEVQHKADYFSLGSLALELVLKFSNESYFNKTHAHPEEWVDHLRRMPKKFDDKIFQDFSSASGFNPRQKRDLETGIRHAMAANPTYRSIEELLQAAIDLQRE